MWEARITKVAFVLGVVGFIAGYVFESLHTVYAAVGVISFVLGAWFMVAVFAFIEKFGNRK